MGRPELPAEQRRDRTIGVAVTNEERERYRVAAKKRGITLAELIRRAVEAFVGQKLT